jgi:hypothetical protein
MLGERRWRDKDLAEVSRSSMQEQLLSSQPIQVQLLGRDTSFGLPAAS